MRKHIKSGRGFEMVISSNNLAQRLCVPTTNKEAGTLGLYACIYTNWAQAQNSCNRCSVIISIGVSYCFEVRDVDLGKTCYFIFLLLMAKALKSDFF
jgi:hypothetical protein